MVISFAEPTIAYRVISYRMPMIMMANMNRLQIVKNESRRGLKKSKKFNCYWPNCLDCSNEGGKLHR